MHITEELRAEARFRASSNQGVLAGLLLRAADEIDVKDLEIERLRGEIHFRVGKNAPDTSKAVSTKIREGTLQYTMLTVFAGRLVAGWTDDELERAMDRTHQSVSAARNTLLRKGYIIDSGQRRKTRSGNDAIVWRLK